MQDIQRFALGTWKSPNDKVVTEAVRYAIEEAGYRHIDGAAVYENEKTVGVALNDVLSRKVVKREELWITSKLWNQKHHAEDVEAACRKTLEDLQIDYLDLYLILWPIPFQRDDKSLFPMKNYGSHQNYYLNI